jgi:hypothetical protein
VDRHPLRHAAWCGVALAALVALVAPATAQAQSCQRDIYAQVVALDQPYFWNRLGAAQPQGQIFALKRDVVAKGSSGSYASLPSAGNVQLRDDKRPRPLVLRMNVGDCLTIEFTNWLSPSPAYTNLGSTPDQPVTREASIHVTGMQLTTIADDGSWVGTNQSSLAAPNQTKIYKLYAEREGTFLLHSAAALTGGPQSDNGSLSTGLFGAVNVEPADSVWYRSQLTGEEFAWASTDKSTWTQPTFGGGYTHGFPVMQYGALYPAGHRFAGTPIVEMLYNNEIIHSDLTAIISGPGGSDLPVGYPPVEVYGNRQEPFREFTIIFHDELGAVQAFPAFYDGDPEHDPQPNGGLAHTLHSVRDAFAINYGTGGIGSEILANRLQVGPMHDCVNCLYEEFFLSAWVVGDPAMVVDIPANAPCTDQDVIESGNVAGEPGYCPPQKGPKATRAFYPEDPSNVYHSYMNDHVKFRNLLAGSDDHHIFHLHAHQWLHSPDGDNSTYLDSQAIGQGTAFTYEIAHNGSGNRNKTPGDSIFHCHFYPHFAQGMWSMWRTHDVLEIGTPLDDSGRPAAYSRALPDGEIAAGTPIPGLVPLPGQPMPLPPSLFVFINNGQVAYLAQAGTLDPTDPTDPTAPAASTVTAAAVVGPGYPAPPPIQNPGYPFYIPAQAGQRPPGPPLDVLHDGGLPRNIVNGGTIQEVHTRLDFTKEVLVANAYKLNPNGEWLEQQAMAYHADLIDGTPGNGFMPSRKPDGTLGDFEVNGSPAVAGAPYADPCYRPAGTDYPNAQRKLTYKAANMEMDVIFNKKGWHYPQQRFIALWEDVADFKNRVRPPEPLFIRANTYDCVEFHHTNLVPKDYELDDFQVRTPTDILGQHIHLVKFDVTSSDGGANGFNYEDGTLSPEEVVHMIHAINLNGGLCTTKACSSKTLLSPQTHPFFQGDEYLGAQTTVQRWYVDDVLNKYNQDRTLRTVFTHDHFGPSTHQQVGLYAGLVTERQGSEWFHNETGAQLGFTAGGQAMRPDGGPTSWQAVIEGPETFREFMFEFGDFQHAYTKDNLSFPDPDHAINPPGRHEKDDLVNYPWHYEKPALAGRCPDNAAPPCPEAVSADDPGTMVVNYRNEPIALRVKDPHAAAQSQNHPQGDLSWSFASIPRDDLDLNQIEPNYQTTLTSTEQLGPHDPYTPVLRVYEDDDVRVRVLVGAHEEEHNFSMHGIRWLFEPEDQDSGWKASQMMGISEFYDFEIPPLLTDDPQLLSDIANGKAVDFLYKAGSSVDDLWNGLWGLIRVTRGARSDLKALSTNADGKAPGVEQSANSFVGPCISNAQVRRYEVYALAAADALSEGKLLYNDRPGLNGSPLNDPTSILFARAGDTQPSAKMAEKYGTEVCAVELKDSAPREPLILRANAGECIQVTLTNCVMQVRDELGYSALPNVVDKFNQNQLTPSNYVGLHAQELSYDVGDSDGHNVGNNPEQTVGPEQTRTYTWYAGITKPKPGIVDPIPVEFGAVTLYSSDPIKHSNKGAVGALIIEPAGSTWEEYPKSRAKAKVKPPGAQPFREFVLVFQDDINLRYGDGSAVPNLKVSEDPAETGQAAVNYRTEPVWFRENQAPENIFNIQLADTFSNNQVPYDPVVGHDPKTPLFHAVAGDPVRFRLVHPGGDSQQHTWGLHGHIWQEEPFVVGQGSKVIGQKKDSLGRPLSEFKGVEYGHGPTNAFDVLPQNGAGGLFGVTGDFMWRDYVSWYLADGIWGIFRVHPSDSALRLYEPNWLLTTTTKDPIQDPTYPPPIQ